MSAKRSLIVNADDFGQSHGINLGIAAAHERGIVTSASLMVRWPAANEAAAYARRHPELSVGLHVDLGEWAFRDGEWVPLYQVISTTDARAIAEELATQLDRFQALIGRPPTHLDSHQHAHRDEPVRTVLRAAALSLAVPLRECDARVAYQGGFYGQSANGTPYPEGICVETLLELLTSLPARITELGCHPGDGGPLDSMYVAERALEVETLCDPRVRAAIERRHIQLRSFSHLPGSPAP